ncbi:hypothetical protein B7P43_G08368 [Cryptotermes secundus]|uniref:Uncharacterized protein n=1 Tax=Cryptotermes secundus TaxID=105785 RepID=A0A2J7Q655_9NEOP|nr:hypothetical protein B7P43_G08368 [Cryptotermes secundus]
MSSLCKNHFLALLYRKIDGAVLQSQNERNLDCVITFQTHSILQRFMLRFDLLQLDCNDHLFIYDGAHAVGSYKGSTRLDKKGSSEENGSECHCVELILVTVFRISVAPHQSKPVWAGAQQTRQTARGCRALVAEPR